MGEHESWAQPSGLLPSQTATVTLPLDPERWGIAEDRTSELIACIQPNIPSMERRNAVADYVRRLILKCFNCQVFTFGSVPLKTYLPDGDIDLTAFSDHHSLKDTWANEVREILENEERSEHAEFRVKEVQYIQAEVKIIKCLVENIVVDISFNQLGGLCTLCFLDEVDVVVGHNHLFKRSIILVKAWCYYESRILGAHHGLISTYALETLVLYIFHVFNNCFSGPLEVLYRFLVFFSNFDWDNYCLSLWGPIPLSALPDIAAEPPRKDGGKLLLNREFLETCGYVYSSQGGPETQVQNFMVKFLNVVDPLRTTNNLGRSVSKGNFFRIRSAFGFGAKKLARILECPKENIISEIDQFFMNTWQRHGSGLRPDAPLDIHQLKPAWPCSDYSKSIVVCKDAEEKPEEQMEQPSSSSSSSIRDERFKYLHGNQSASTGILGHPSERNNRCSTYLETVTTKGGSSSISKGVSKRSQHQISSTRSQKGTKTDIFNAESQNIKGISRVYSSPELTDVTRENNARGRKGRPETAEALRNHAISSRNDQNVAERRRKNVSSDSPNSYFLKTTGTNDSVRFRHNSSHGNVDPNNASEALNYGSTLTSANEGKGSVIQGEDMVENTHPSYQDGQVQSNLIGVSRPHFVNRQIPPPLDFSSLQLSVPIAPSLLTPVYAPRNISGMVRNAAPIADSAWGLGQHTSHMQFPPGHVPPMPVCIPNLGANGQPHFDDADVSEKVGSLESYQEELEQHYDSNSCNKIEDQDTLLGHAAGFDVKGMRSSHAIHTGVTESLSQETPSSPSKLVRTQKKSAKDNREELQEERLNNSYSFSTRRMFDDSRGELNPKGATYHENEVSRTSESTWAGTSGRISKFSKDKRGKGRGHGNNEYSTSKVRDVVPSNHSKSHSSWHIETNIDGPSTADKLISQDVRSFVSKTESVNSSDQVPFELSKSSVLSTASDSLPVFSQGRNGGSISTAVSRVQPVVIPTYDSTTAVSPDAITSGDNVSPVLYGQGLQYRTGDNSGLPPFAFYPTGPPLQLFMFPLSYIPTDGSNAGDRSGSFDNMRASDDPLDSGLDHSEHFVDSSSYEMGESSEQPETHSSNMGSVDPSIDHEDEMKSDILCSDFNSHWLNLRYGRFCLNSHFPNQLFYPPSPVPPMYLQGHFPLDGPGRPLSSTNMNMLSQLVGYGHRFMPIMPLQPNASRPTNNFQRFNGPNRLYGEDLPRYRGGTGTYLPTPRQVPYQDRQPSGTKGNRSYGHDRRDHGDRDAGSVFVPKNKGAGGRNQSRYDQRHQFDRSNSRVDRNSEGKGGERTWDSYRNENRRRGSYQSNHNQFPSANPPINAGSMAHSSSSMSYGMYPFQSMNNVGNTPQVQGNGPAVSPVFMLYPCDHNMPLEFGSLGPVRLGEAQDGRLNGGVPRLDEIPYYEQKHGTYQNNTSPRGSPPEPSSPDQHQRSTYRSYQMKDEDFPPLSFQNQPGKASNTFSLKNHSNNSSSQFQSCLVSPS